MKAYISYKTLFHNCTEKLEIFVGTHAPKEGDIVWSVEIRATERQRIWKAGRLHSPPLATFKVRNRLLLKLEV